MWTVAKVKSKEINIFKEKLVEKFGKDTKFYSPKVKYQKFFKNKIKKYDKYILENYLFCYSKKFDNIENNFSELKFIQGLEYFVRGHEQNQKEILNFINHCQSYENQEGYITPAFFKSIINKKAKFISGPFTNMMFEIIEKQKNKLKIIIGEIVTTISDKGNYLYRSV